jgi:hypothetical protein
VVKWAEKGTRFAIGARRRLYLVVNNSTIPCAATACCFWVADCSKFLAFLALTSKSKFLVEIHVVSVGGSSILPRWPSKMPVPIASLLTSKSKLLVEIHVVSASGSSTMTVANAVPTAPLLAAVVAKVIDLS